MCTGKNGWRSHAVIYNNSHKFIKNYGAYGYRYNGPFSIFTGLWYIQIAEFFFLSCFFCFVAKQWVYDTLTITFKQYSMIRNDFPLRSTHSYAKLCLRGGRGVVGECEWNRTAKHESIGHRGVWCQSMFLLLLVRGLVRVQSSQVAFFTVKWLVIFNIDTRQWIWGDKTNKMHKKWLFALCARAKRWFLVIQLRVCVCIHLCAMHIET